MNCPHCGKRVNNVFESTSQIEPSSPNKPGLFDDVIMFGGSMLLSATGTYAILWHAGLDFYWVAPCVGLCSALGLAALRFSRYRPELPQPKQDTSIIIDVKDKSERGRQQWQLDAFQGCRVSMLYKFADAVINKSIPITRRPMMQVGVSQGQFELIRLRMLERGWVDVESDLSNATAYINWRGRAVLRGVLADSPTPSRGLVGRGWAYRQPPHHHPTTHNEVSK